MTGFIDGHAHVFRPATEVPRVVDDLAPADRSAGVDDLLANLEDIGGSGAVLVPLGVEDATAAAALADHPGRFAGVAVAGPDDVGPAGPAHLAARAETYPFGAVRMMSFGPPGQPLVDSPAWPTLQLMAERDWVLWSYLGPQQAPYLLDLVAALPTLRIVLNHLGFTPVDMHVDSHRRPRFTGGIADPDVERVLRLSDHEQVHLMVSGHYALSETEPPYDDLRTVTRRLVGAYGAERSLWASDSPWPATVPGYADTFHAAEQLLGSLEAAAHADIFGDTVRRLFPDSFLETT